MLSASLNKTFPSFPPSHTYIHDKIAIIIACAFLRGISKGELEAIWKEGNVLFNDTLNTFYLRLYGVRYLVKDHSDS